MNTVSCVCLLLLGLTSVIVAEESNLSRGVEDSFGFLQDMILKTLAEIHRVIDCLLELDPTCLSESMKHKKTTPKPKPTTTMATTTRVFTTEKSDSLNCRFANGVDYHPRNCKLFILCVNWIPRVGECPVDMFFDRKTNSCDYDSSSCDQKEEAYFRWPWQKKSTPWTPPTQPPRITCPRSDGYFSFQPDCKRFIECVHWTPYVRHCPSSLTFNPSLSLCDKPGKSNPCWSKHYFANFRPEGLIQQPRSQAKSIA